MMINTKFHKKPFWIFQISASLFNTCRKWFSWDFSLSNDTQSVSMILKMIKILHIKYKTIPMRILHICSYCQTSNPILDKKLYHAKCDLFQSNYYHNYKLRFIQQKCSYTLFILLLPCFSMHTFLELSCSCFPIFLLSYVSS